MIKILRLLKYDKTQYDKHFGKLYHMALSKYDKKKNLWPGGDFRRTGAPEAQKLGER